jgi:hypothetical protein
MQGGEASAQAVVLRIKMECSTDQDVQQNGKHATATDLPSTPVQTSGVGSGRER